MPNNVQLDPETEIALERLARRTAQSRSEIVRQAIELKVRQGEVQAIILRIEPLAEPAGGNHRVGVDSNEGRRKAPSPLRGGAERGSHSLWERVGVRGVFPLSARGVGDSAAHEAGRDRHALGFGFQPGVRAVL